LPEEYWSGSLVARVSSMRRIPESAVTMASLPEVNVMGPTATLNETTRTLGASPILSCTEVFIAADIIFMLLDTYIRLRRAQWGGIVLLQTQLSGGCKNVAKTRRLSFLGSDHCFRARLGLTFLYAP